MEGALIYQPGFSLDRHFFNHFLSPPFSLLTLSSIWPFLVALLTLQTQLSHCLGLNYFVCLSNDWNSSMPPSLTPLCYLILSLRLFLCREV